MVYPPSESLASAPPQPNTPMEDKSHNLRVDIVDPIHLLAGVLVLQFCTE